MALSDIRLIPYVQGKAPDLPASKERYLVTELEKIRQTLDSMNRAIEIIKQELEQ